MKRTKLKVKLKLLKDRKLFTTRTEVFKQARELHHQLDYIRKHVDKLWEQATTNNERLQDLEIQVNLISRLITLLCIEKLGMKLRMFRRLVRRVEKETITDLQIHHLEELYRLEPKKKPSS